jgi:hypothetical protein
VLNTRSMLPSALTMGGDCRVGVAVVVVVGMVVRACGDNDNVAEIKNSTKQA